MSAAQRRTKAEQFIDDMIRCRGIEFAQLGMMVEVDGNMGTIQGINASASLNVKFANELTFGNHSHNCHPMWRVKYFDATGALIAHFDDDKCVVRPKRPAA